MIIFVMVFKRNRLFLGQFLWRKTRLPNTDTLSMHNIANYDVTATCGYVGCPFNGFKNPLAPLNQSLPFQRFNTGSIWPLFVT